MSEPCEHGGGALDQHTRHGSQSPRGPNARLVQIFDFPLSHIADRRADVVVTGRLVDHCTQAAHEIGGKVVCADCTTRMELELWRIEAEHRRRDTEPATGGKRIPCGRRDGDEEAQAHTVVEVGRRSKLGEDASSACQREARVRHACILSLTLCSDTWRRPASLHACLANNLRRNSFL